MKRWKTLVVLSVLVPSGIITKLYGGPLAVWVNKYGGDIVSPVFIFFLVTFVLPSLSPLKCGAWVFIFCVAVEFSQFLSCPVIASLRGNVAGRTVLGSDFDWLDFAFYIIGIAVAVALHYWIKEKNMKDTRPCRSRGRPRGICLTVAVMLSLAIPAGASFASDGERTQPGPRGPELADGQYEGYCRRALGMARVKVTVEHGEIAAIDIVSRFCSPWGRKAFEQMPGRMLKAQTADVDAVTGATYSSETLKAAVADALEKAKKAGGGGL